MYNGTVTVTNSLDIADLHEGDSVDYNGTNYIYARGNKLLAVTTDGGNCYSSYYGENVLQPNEEKLVAGTTFEEITGNTINFSSTVTENTFFVKNGKAVAQYATTDEGLTLSILDISDAYKIKTSDNVTVSDSYNTRTYAPSGEIEITASATAQSLAKGTINLTDYTRFVANGYEIYRNGGNGITLSVDDNGIVTVGGLNTEDVFYVGNDIYKVLENGITKEVPTGDYTADTYIHSTATSLTLSDDTSWTKVKSLVDCYSYKAIPLTDENISIIDETGKIIAEIENNTLTKVDASATNFDVLNVTDDWNLYSGTFTVTNSTPLTIGENTLTVTSGTVTATVTNGKVTAVSSDGAATVEYKEKTLTAAGAFTANYYDDGTLSSISTAANVTCNEKTFEIIGGEVTATFDSSGDLTEIYNIDAGETVKYDGNTWAVTSGSIRLTFENGECEVNGIGGDAVVTYNGKTYYADGSTVTIKNFGEDKAITFDEGLTLSEGTLISSADGQESYNYEVKDGDNLIFNLQFDGLTTSNKVDPHFTNSGENSFTYVTLKNAATFNLDNDNHQITYTAATGGDDAFTVTGVSNIKASNISTDANGKYNIELLGNSSSEIEITPAEDGLLDGATINLNSNQNLTAEFAATVTASESRNTITVNGVSYTNANSVLTISTTAETSNLISGTVSVTGEQFGVTVTGGGNGNNSARVTFTDGEISSIKNIPSKGSVTYNGTTYTRITYSGNEYIYNSADNKIYSADNDTDVLNLGEAVEGRAGVTVTDDTIIFSSDIAVGTYFIQATNLQL